MTQKAWKTLYESYQGLNANQQGRILFAYYEGLVVFNPTSWTRSVEVVEVEMSSIIPNAERLTNGEFQQISADGKAGLVLLESIPGLAVKAFPFGNLPNNFKPITGICHFLIIPKYLNFLIPHFH